MDEQATSQKTIVLQITVPPKFKEELEKQRRTVGARSWAEMIRDKIGCPQPNTPEWDALMVNQVEKAQ